MIKIKTILLGGGGSDKFGQRFPFFLDIELCTWSLRIIYSYTYCSGVRNITGGTLFFPQFWTDLDESGQEDGP